MSKAKYIKIEQLKVLKNRILFFKLSCSKNVEKYFLSNLFYVEHDEDVHNISKSILYIPVVSSLITVAWAIGADIYVNELDKTFLESLSEIKSVMKNWYPKLSFSADIHVEKVCSNRFSNKGYGLLFSGGIDSTTSYIRHKNKKPNLIMFWGVDFPFVGEELWVKVKNEYEDFARRENVKINFIKTNTRRFLNERLLRVEFGGHLTDFSWWGGFRHGITLLGLCAPITVEHIGTILIAASGTRGSKRPWGSHPLIDNKISWADVRVVNDCYELNRQEKIRHVLKKYIKNSGYYPTLRVCWTPFRDFNCSRCEKCSRTITGLLLENIDPNKCGFNVNSKFSDFLKQNLGRLIRSESEAIIWKRIQQQIPKAMDHNLYGSKELFKWLRTFDTSRNTRNRNIDITKNCLLYIYYKLPSDIQNKVKHFLNQHKPFSKPLVWLL